MAKLMGVGCRAMDGERQKRSVQDALEALACEVGHRPGKDLWLGAHWVVDMGDGVRDTIDCGNSTDVADLIKQVGKARDLAEKNLNSRIELRAYADLEVCSAYLPCQVEMIADVCGDVEGEEYLDVRMFSWNDARFARETAISEGELTASSSAGLPPLGAFFRDGIHRSYRNLATEACLQDVLSTSFRCSPYEQPWPYDSLSFADGNEKRRVPRGMEVEAPEGARYEVSVRAGEEGAITVEWTSGQDGDLLVRAEALPGFNLIVLRDGDGDGDAILEFPGHGMVERRGLGYGDAIRRGGTGGAVRWGGIKGKGIVEPEIPPRQEEEPRKKPSSSPSP